MTKDQIIKYKNQVDMRAITDNKNKSYVEGENYGIKTADNLPKPDNRIPIPLAKSAITDTTGFLGKVGEIKTNVYLKTYDADGKLIKEQDEVTKQISEWLTYNQEGLENSELLKTSLSLGRSNELWWVSDELKGNKVTPEFKIVNPSHCMAIYDDSLKPKMTNFLRYFTDSEGNNHCYDYQPLTMEAWVQTKQDDWERDNQSDTTYPYTQVPAIEFQTNMEKLPLFNAQKPIMDALDTLTSKTQNEIDRFNALITLFPDRMRPETFKKLSEQIQGYIDDLGKSDKWPEYLQKDYSGVQEFYTKQAEKLERYFYQTLKVPNMMDDSFAGGETSAKALRYKLIGFELLASEIEIYFKQGMIKRFELLKDIFATDNINWDDYEIEVAMKRNLPVDDKEKIEIAIMMKGLGYSAETISKYIPDSITVDDLPEFIEEEEIDNLDTQGDLDSIDLEQPQTQEALKLSGIQIRSANEIIQKVKDGLITREAGIEQLMIFLGLSEDQANRVMGKVAR